MSDTRRRPPRPAAASRLAAAEEAAVVSKDAPPRPLEQPLLTPPAAFACAGLCFAIAGYLATTVSAWGAVYQSMGVDLPWLTTIIHRHELGSVVALCLAGLTLLCLGWLRHPPGPLHRLVHAGAFLLSLAAAAAGYCSMLPLMEMSKTLQQ